MSIESFIVADFVTVAGSNLFFWAVLVVGAGFVALAITPPPPLT